MGIVGDLNAGQGVSQEEREALFDGILRTYLDDPGHSIHLVRSGDVTTIATNMLRDELIGYFETLAEELAKSLGSPDGVNDGLVHLAQQTYLGGDTKTQAILQVRS